MKTIKCLAIVSLLIVGCTVSFKLGQASHGGKHYKAACHMSDVIRHYLDEVNDSDTVVEDYGCFEEFCGIYLWDDCIADSPVKLENYSWCY